MDIYSEPTPQEVERHTEADVKRHLNISLDVENIVQLASHIHDNSEKWTKTLLQLHPRDARKIACRKGCAYCCYVPVDSSVIEIIGLVEYINTHFTEDEIINLRHRVAEAHRETVNLTFDERGESLVACPLLKEDGVCSVYPARPLACRGWNSFNVNECKRSYDHPEEKSKLHLFMAQVELSAFMQQGIKSATEEIGLTPGLVRLIPALHILLNDSAAADDWLCGRDILESAIADEAPNEPSS